MKMFSSEVPTYLILPHTPLELFEKKKSFLNQEPTGEQ